LHLTSAHALRCIHTITHIFQINCTVADHIYSSRLYSHTCTTIIINNNGNFTSLLFIHNDNV